MRGTAVGNWAKRGASVVTLCVGVACVAGSCAKLDQNGALVPQVRERMPSFAPVVQAVVPAVVNVTAVQSLGEAAMSPGSPSVRLSKYQDGTRTSSSPTIDELLQRFFDGLAEGAPSASRTTVGSGFIIDPSGYIVTEDHVVEGAKKVTVTFHDGTSHPARIVGRDIKTDLALLKIDVDRQLPHVDWGDSDAALVGDWVLAVGNPFGFDASVSGGIISGRGRNINLGPYDDFLRIDAAINVGILGGPQFRSQGSWRWTPNMRQVAKVEPCP